MKRLKLFLSALLLSVSSVVVFIAPHAFAATKTWTGGGVDTKMTTAGNWTGGAPTAGDDLVFPANITNRAVNNDFTAATSFNSIAFTGAATQASGYTLTGNSMTVVAGITNTMTGAFDLSQHINIPLILGADETFDGGSAYMAIGGTINLGSHALTVHVAPNTNFNLDGVISGTGSLVKTGNGILFVTAANLYSGQTTISAGTLASSVPTSLGTSAGGTSVAAGAELFLGNQSGSDVSYAEPFTLAGDGATPSIAVGQALFGGTPPSNLSTLTGTVTLSSDVILAASDQNGKVTGDIVGNHSLSLSSSSDGTFELASSNNGSATANGVLTLPVKTTNYADNTPNVGFTVHTNETAIVSGTYGAVLINAGGILKGTGTVGDVTSSGTIAPGNSPGCLNTGNLVMFTGSYQFQVGGKTACTQYDQIKVTGTVQVGGALDVSLYNGFKPVLGQKYIIISNDGSDAITTTFDGLAEGATVTLGTYKFSISYKGGDGNDVVLTVTGGAPDTGFSLVANSPFVGTAIIIAAAGTIAFMARRSLKPAVAYRKR